VINLVAAGIALGASAAGAVEVKVISGGEPAVKAEDCRRMLVGPGVNQREPVRDGEQRALEWPQRSRSEKGRLWQFSGLATS